MDTSPISGLCNPGPQSRDMLASITIHELADLTWQGATGAFTAFKAVGCPASLNLLWAMKGTLSGGDWREAARDNRLRLLLELGARQIQHHAVRGGPGI